MDACQFLDENGIGYQRCDHPAVYTAEEAFRLVPELPGQRTKNLFLRDRRGRHHFLVLMPAQSRVDLAGLSQLLGCPRLSFGSPARLDNVLGVEPGSVSLLSIINDIDNNVEVIIDESVWQDSHLQCHPLINTSTLVLERAGVRKLLEVSGHDYRVLPVPCAA